jgi:hypothetical protein
MRVGHASRWFADGCAVAHTHAGVQLVRTHAAQVLHARGQGIDCRLQHGPGQCTPLLGIEISGRFERDAGDDAGNILARAQDRAAGRRGAGGIAEHGARVP